MRAESRYRFLGVAFALIVSLAPLALLAAALRPARFAGSTIESLPGSFAIAGPIAVSAAVVALILLCSLVADVARVLGVKRRAVPCGRVSVRSAALGESPVVLTPTAIGYVHPAVIVPADFRARVDAAEWAAILAHESAHLARHDDWAKAVQSTFVRAGWWLPGLWILARALDLERELASDERAAAATGARRYASCLLRLATDRCGDVAPALWGRRSHVAIRVERLLRPVPGTSFAGRAVALGAFTATALALILAALVAVPAIAPVPTGHPQARRVAWHPTPRHLLSRPAAHVIVRSKQPAQPYVSRPLALAPARVLAVPSRPLRTAHRHPVATSPRSRPLAASRPAPALVAALAHRRCATCFGTDHIAGDSVGTGPKTDRSVDGPALEEGGGTAASLLWIRLPASVVNP